MFLLTCDWWKQWITIERRIWTTLQSGNVGTTEATKNTTKLNCSLSLTSPYTSSKYTVASLGWVTPGAATEGVTPLFFPEKPGDLFCSSLSLSLSLFIAFTRVCPLQGVTPHLFYLSDLVSPLFFVNLPTNFFLRVSPLEGVTRDGPPPPSDSTG